MSALFQIKKFYEIKDLLAQHSGWIQRLQYDCQDCDNEIIAFAKGDVWLNNLNLDFISLNIELNDQRAIGQVCMVLIQGNVSAKNIVNNETDGAVSLFVLGDLEADNIIVGGQQIYVCGDLNVHGLFWGDYNHGELSVKGAFSAKVFLSTDYHFDWKRFYNNENVDIGLLLGDDEANGDYPRELLETAFQKECLLNEEDIDGEIYGFKDWLDTIEISKRLSANIPILLDRITTGPQDQIPLVFESDSLTDHNMERFRTSSLFSLFGTPETKLKQLEFHTGSIYTRVQLQPSKAFSTNIYLQHKQEYAVMIFYFMYEGNLRSAIVHKSLAGADQQWHSLNMEQAPRYLKELIETGWKNLLREFSAAEYYYKQFYKQINVQEINNILYLPVVKNKYSDYYNDQGKSLYIANLMYQFRQKEDEKDQCARISVVKSVPCALKQEDKLLFYHFDVLEDTAEKEAVWLRTQHGNGYESKVYSVPLTNTQKYKDALKYFYILKKKIFEANKKYIRENE